MLEGPPPDADDDPNLQRPQEPDRLERLNEMMRRARSLKLEAEDLETRRKAVNVEFNDLVHRQLPDLFAQTGTSVHAVAPEGNMPGYEGRLKPWHKAVISAEWEPERQARGYAVLRDLGAADLVRNTVTVEFGRGEDVMADHLVEYLRHLGVLYRRGQAVPWSTLTAWLREQCTKFRREFTSDQLEALGATVGQIVEVKQVRSRNETTDIRVTAYPL